VALNNSTNWKPNSDELHNAASTLGLARALRAVALPPQVTAGPTQVTQLRCHSNMQYSCNPLSAVGTWLIL